MDSKQFANTYTDKFLNPKILKDLPHPNSLSNSEYYYEFFEKTGKQLSEFSRFIHECKNDDFIDCPDDAEERRKHMINPFLKEKWRLDLFKPINSFYCPIKNFNCKNYQDKLWIKISEHKLKPMLCEFKSPVDPIHRIELEEMIRGDVLLHNDIEQLIKFSEFNHEERRNLSDINNTTFYCIEPDRSVSLDLNEQYDTIQRYLVTTNCRLELNPWNKIDKFVSKDCIQFTNNDEFKNHLFFDSKINLLDKYKDMKIVSSKDCVELERFTNIEVSRDPKHNNQMIMMRKSMIPDELDRRFMLKKIRSTPLKAAIKTLNQNSKKELLNFTYKFPAENYLKKPKNCIESDIDKFKKMEACNVVEK